MIKKILRLFKKESEKESFLKELEKDYKNSIMHEYKELMDSCLRSIKDANRKFDKSAFTVNFYNEKVTEVILKHELCEMIRDKLYKKGIDSIVVLRPSQSYLRVRNTSSFDRDDSAYKIEVFSYWNNDTDTILKNLADIEKELFNLHLKESDIKCHIVSSVK